jgi:hypothetical protein
LNDEAESTNDTTISSISGESPIDEIESHDNHIVLSNIPNECPASLVKRSILDNDYDKDKQVHRSSEQKTPSSSNYFFFLMFINAINYL